MTGSIKILLKADGLLLLVAVIWGFSFVAQRSGMDSIGPYAFNAVRFALGAISLLPFLLILRRRKSKQSVVPTQNGVVKRVGWSVAAGGLLFIAASLQQTGLVFTTAGNAGFIPCLYVVWVPLIGRLLGHKTGFRVWAGAVLALVGLYVLSIGGGFTLARGDGLELLGSFFWAGHILFLTFMGTRMDPLELSIGQFTTCSIISLLVAVIVEPHAFTGIQAAVIPILYGGLVSVGIAYTLQVVAQRTAKPAHASIILSMEALFAAVGGVLLLQESLTLRLVCGGLLMLIGMIASQTGDD